MVLSARYIKKQRNDDLRFCAHCEWPIADPHIRLYGMAHWGEKPYNLFFHTDCITEAIDVSQESKIEAVLSLLPQTGERMNSDESRTN